ncbi:Unknown protein sequence [Pseudomonas savastanoi pv. phaseolicola]|nr:Unknown protein sequence [Pseudomonas savastanoi pv. phaseolicola]KPB73283.1 Unknown protein sequence [Pseudomonas amygdali pv. mellea]
MASTLLVANSVDAESGGEQAALHRLNRWFTRLLGHLWHC